jgi:hypothetical protein
MKVCPPGFICLSNGVVFVIVIIILVVYYFLINIVNNEKKDMIQKVIIQKEEVDLEQPEREYRGYSRGVPINVKTRAQDTYQQVGVLSKISPLTTSSSINTPGNNTETSVLPLFGRRVYKGSNLWNYYTSTSDHSIVKIPIYINSENCSKERGCSELSNGSTVDIKQLNGKYTVEIYEYDAPRYIPYI